MLTSTVSRVTNGDVGEGSPAKSVLRTLSLDRDSADPAHIFCEQIQSGEALWGRDILTGSVPGAFQVMGAIGGALISRPTEREQ